MEIICRKISYAGCNTRVKFLVVLSVLLSICSGMLSIVFAYIVKITVDYATNDLRYSFVETVANIVRLLLLMVTIDLSRNIVIAKTIFYVNSNIKSKLFRSFFDNQKRNHDTDFIPASNEPSGCLQTFGDCREGQRPRCSAALQV